MPAVTLPNISAGTTDADELALAFNAPADPPVSLDIINGQLDADNMSAGVELDYSQISRNTYTISSQVGATANLDFFEYLFPTFGGATDDIEDILINPINDYIPIPNAVVNFYLPKAARIICTWNIFFASDASTTEDGTARYSQTAVYLFVDGEYVDESRRGTYTSVNKDVVTGIPVFGPGRFSSFDQHYSGHHFINNMSAGWHSMGLYVGSNTKQSRIRVRSLRVIAFL